MSRLARALSLAACVACARPAGPALSVEQAGPRVAALLDAPDAGPGEFAALGPSAAPALRAELLDPRASEAHRIAAARMLAGLPGPEGLTLLAGSVGAPGLSPALRDAAAEELGAHDRDVAVAGLTPLLGSEDAAVRAAAARGLGRAGGPAARKSLEDRLEREEDPGVRERLQASLARTQP